MLHVGLESVMEEQRMKTEQLIRSRWIPADSQTVQPSPMFQELPPASEPPAVAVQRGDGGWGGGGRLSQLSHLCAPQLRAIYHYDAATLWSKKATAKLHILMPLNAGSRNLSCFSRSRLSDLGSSTLLN